MFRAIFATAAAIAALTCAAAPAQAECWDVITLDSGKLMFLDLEGRTYTEYRIIGPVTPERARNPEGYHVIFTLLVDHDVDSDAIVGSTIVAEARYPGGENMVYLDAEGSQIDVWIDAANGRPAARQTGMGDAMGLFKDRSESIGSSPVDAAAGRAIYTHAISGGTVKMRFTYEADGKPSLDASFAGAFPPDPAYQAVLGPRAREFAAKQRSSGACPLGHHG